MLELAAGKAEAWKTCASRGALAAL